MKKIVLLILLIPSLCFGAEPPDLAWMNVTNLAGTIPVAAPASFCSSATSTASTTGVMCEDFEGATQCAATYSSNCRAAWTVTAGTPDFDYGTAIAGIYSINIPAYTNAAELALSRGWTYTNTTTYYGYAKVKAINIPVVGTTKNLFMIRENTGNRCFIAWKNNGSAVVWSVIAGGGSEAVTVNTITEGTTYNVWWRFSPGSGANAECHLAFSSTTTKPSDPSNGYAKSTNGTATTSVNNWYMNHEYSSGGQCNDAVWDDLFVDDADITGVPN